METCEELLGNAQNENTYLKWHIHSHSLQAGLIVRGHVLLSLPFATPKRKALNRCAISRRCLAHAEEFARLQGCPTSLTI